VTDGGGILIGTDDVMDCHGASNEATDAGQERVARGHAPIFALKLVTGRAYTFPHRNLSSVPVVSASANPPIRREKWSGLPAPSFARCQIRIEHWMDSNDVSQRSIGRIPHF
jgi:hypothetical protein